MPEDVELEGRFQRVGGPRRPEPAPGVYEELAGLDPEDNKATVLRISKSLVDSGVAVIAAERAAEDMVGSHRFLVVDGKALLFVEKAVSTDEYGVEVFWHVGRAERESSTNGFKLHAEEQDSAMVCRMIAKGVECSIAERTTVWTKIDH